MSGTEAEQIKSDILKRYEDRTAKSREKNETAQRFSYRKMLFRHLTKLIPFSGVGIIQA
ncbi:MAG: hypothetical protein HN580_28510 [Deltaproteobacteria bacterium]|jgi:hypothetical protein|nr:hypothetical protein [Deltaproteobacteria bacterium]MBT4266842.1 hypothetical protein [Deltaproteobacteria bacterium]MBT4640843.1 hypothetical protein [Deltaproteobacteria bacterium]MBT6502364.1 hypothetical protein [Deltaproteobacteria bacterium]MBT6611207.1 hypothetical protein [Deltaproteobacteria bacterium]